MESKINIKPSSILYPAPAIMVSCGNGIQNNIITISWTGTINSIPPMCSISIRPERFSHKIIKDSGEFVINLTTTELAKVSDWCGVKSGKDYNKFDEMGLTAVKGNVVNAPIIAESPVNIECKVKQIISLGSHDMFIAEVVEIQIDKSILLEGTAGVDWSKLNLIHYFGGHYYEVGKMIGKTGFSLK